MDTAGFPNEYARDLYKAGCADALEERTVCPVCGDNRFSLRRNHRTQRTEAKYSCGLILELHDKPRRSPADPEDGGGIHLGAPCRKHELDWLKSVVSDIANRAVLEADMKIISLEGGSDG